MGMTAGPVVKGLYHKWSFSLGKEKNENLAEFEALIPLIFLC